MEYFQLRHALFTSKHPRQLKKRIQRDDLLFPSDCNPLLFQLPGYYVLLECSDKIEIHFTDLNENLIYLMNIVDKLSIDQLISVLEWARTTTSSNTKKLIIRVLTQLRVVLSDFVVYATGLTKCILKSDLLLNDVVVLFDILEYIQITQAITFQLCYYLNNEQRNAISKVIIKCCPLQDVAHGLYIHNIHEFKVATLILANIKNRRPFYKYYDTLCTLFDYKDGYTVLSIDQLFSIYNHSTTIQQILFRCLSYNDMSQFLDEMTKDPLYFISHFNPHFSNDFISALNGHDYHFEDLLYYSACVEFKVFCCKCIYSNLLPSANLIDVLFKMCLFTNFKSLLDISKLILLKIPKHFYNKEYCTSLASLCCFYLNTSYPTLRDACIHALLIIHAKHPIPNLSSIFHSHKVPHLQSAEYILQCGYELIAILNSTPTTQLDGLGDEAIVLSSTVDLDVSKVWRQLRDIAQYMVNHYMSTLFINSKHQVDLFFITIFKTIRHWGVLSELVPLYTIINKHKNDQQLLDHCIQHYDLIKQSIQVNRLDGKYSGLAYLILCPLRAMGNSRTFIEYLIKDVPSRNTTIISLIFILLNDPKIGVILIEYTYKLMNMILLGQDVLQWRGKLLNGLLKRHDQCALHYFMTHYKVHGIIIKALQQNEDCRLLALITINHFKLPKLSRNDFCYSHLIQQLIECGASIASKNRCLAARIVQQLLKPSEVHQITKTKDANFNHFVQMLQHCDSLQSVVIQQQQQVMRHEDASLFRVEKTSWNLLKLNQQNEGEEEDVVLYYYNQGKLTTLPKFEVDYETVLKGDCAFEYAMYITKHVIQE